LRSHILSILSSFVTRGLIFAALNSGIALAGPSDLAKTDLDIPSADALAAALGHKPKEFKKNVSDFALALSQGNQSQALKRLCAKDEESCTLVKDFQEQAADAKRERLKARRRGRPFRVTEANVSQAQRFGFQILVNNLKLDKAERLYSLSEKSLQETGCPRNLSAALAVQAEEFFPDAKARELSRELFEHAKKCLQPADAPFEKLYLRQGLYSIYEGDKDRAKELLLEAMKSTHPSERYRVLYWLGKLGQKDGSEPEDNEYWKALSDEFPLSFYAIEASVALKRDPMEMINKRKLGGLKREVADDPELNRMLRWLEALYVFKKSSAVAKWASWIVRTNEDALDVEVLHYISTLKIAAGLYRSNISMLFSYFKKNPEALNQDGLRLLYPRPYYSLVEKESKGRIDAFLVLGLIRQESAFDARAVSPARAKGLMQIVPKTARRLASQGHRKLLNEKANTHMGVKYLLQLGKRFDGSAELVLAAYNAGPVRVDEWLKRNPKRAEDPLLWNDLIPYMETRDYVTSILRNNYLYARLYGEESEGENIFASRLVKDLLANAAAADEKK
jgi:soluble lytic murein transglycosylase